MYPQAFYLPATTLNFGNLYTWIISLLFSYFCTSNFLTHRCELLPVKSGWCMHSMCQRSGGAVSFMISLLHVQTCPWIVPFYPILLVWIWKMIKWTRICACFYIDKEVTFYSGKEKWLFLLCSTLESLLKNSKQIGSSEAYLFIHG
jgi:hypothetical protein